MISGLSAGSVAGWRFLIAGVLLALYQILRGDKITKLNRWMVIGAVAFATDIYLWHHAILSIGGGLATVLTNTQVIYMSLMSIKQKEFKKPWMVIVAALLGVLGVFLLFYDRIFSTSGVNSSLPLFDRVQGLVFGLVAGMLYTVFLVCFTKAQEFDRQKMKSNVSALQTLTWVSLIGGAGILIFESTLAQAGLREWNQLIPQNFHQISWLLILAIVIHIGGWVELGNALNHYKKATMGLILLLQPVMSTAWAWILFGERMNHLQLVGALAIFIALLIIRLAQSRD